MLDNLLGSFLIESIFLGLNKYFNREDIFLSLSLFDIILSKVNFFIIYI